MAKAYRAVVRVHTAAGAACRANEWSLATRAVIRGEAQVYWCRLAAAEVVLWLAALTLVGADRDEIGNAPEVAGA